MSGRACSRLVLLGPPGSGKGTQAARLAAELRVPAISTGEILRAQQVRDGRHADELRRYLDRGELVPDSLVIEIIRHRLGDPDTAAGFILDGFPRTGAQGEALDAMLAELQRPIERTVYLKIGAAALLERLRRRNALEQRSDDRPEVVGHRIEVYLAQTAPLIDYYRRSGRLSEVDGDRTPEEVHSSILSQIRAGDDDGPGGGAWVVRSARLDLVLLKAEAIRRLLAGDRDLAESIAGLPIPPDFGGPRDEIFLRLQLLRIERLPRRPGWTVRLMVRREDGIVIGSIGFHGPPELVGRAEIGYTVFPPYRRLGYAIEGVRALLGMGGV